MMHQLHGSLSDEVANELDFYGEVVNALDFHEEDRWFEFGRRRSKYPTVEVGTWFLMFGKETRSR